MKVVKTIKVEDIKGLPKKLKVLVIDGEINYIGKYGRLYKSWEKAAASFLSPRYCSYTDIFGDLEKIFKKEGIDRSAIKRFLYKKFDGRLQTKFLDELALETIKEIYVNNLTIEFDVFEGEFYPTN